MATSKKVVLNKATRTVTILEGTAATPGGTTLAGSFTPKRNKPAIAFVRDLLYKLGYQDLQRLKIQTTPGLSLAA